MTARPIVEGHSPRVTKQQDEARPLSTRGHRPGFVDGTRPEPPGPGSLALGRPLVKDDEFGKDYPFLAYRILLADISFTWTGIYGDFIGSIQLDTLANAQGREGRVQGSAG